MKLGELLKYTFSMFKPPAVQTVSEWADENRVLVSESSSEPGRWKTDRAPYQREIMDAFTQPGISEIVIMSSAQVGKSEIELNMMGKAIDHDPGPMLYIQPTDKVAEDYSKRRIAPMISACPSLRDKVFKAKGRDSQNTITMKTFAGGSLAIIGANSPSDLASKPVRYIFMDEIDRFPASAGTEGDPIELAERRTETYRYNRKVVKTSTPTIKGTSKIEKAYLKGTQEEWHTECPHCHKYSFIQFNDVVFEKSVFEDEEKEKHWTVRNARWRCPVCKKEIPEHEAKRLPAKWVIRNEKAIQNGIRSFRMNAFMSPWSDWRDIALKFLQAKDDPEMLRVFHNTMLGESWEARRGDVEIQPILNRREHYNAEVPTGVLILTMGIDVQDNRLEYEVVGWAQNEESWGIEKGVILGRADGREIWEVVDDLLDREWEMRSGKRLRVLATFVDSGGHFTQDVYRACKQRESRRMYAIKGEGGDKPYVRMMKNPAGGVTGLIIGVDSGKEAIMYASTIESPGAKYMHFPLNPQKGYDEEYFKGLFSEKMVIRRKMGQSVVAWEKIRERNEPLDCRNYARAAFKFFRWNFSRYESEINGNSPAAKPAAEQTKKPKRMISAGIKL